MTWPIKKLREIAEVGAGNSAPQEKEYFLNGTIPFFRTSDVGKIHLSNDLNIAEDLLNEDAIRDLKIKVYPKRTILFPKSGASTFLNHRVMIGTEGAVSSHLATIVAREEVLQAFLFYFLLLIDAKKLTADQNYPSLRVSDIQNIKIPLPPLATQKQIVGRLDKVAEAQKLNNELIQKSDELYRSLLHNELSVKFKNQNAKLQFKIKKLGEVCEINPSKKEISGLPDNLEVSFLTMADVSNDAEMISIQTRKLGEIKKGFTYFRDGDVLVAKITPCFENGKGAFVEEMKNGIGFGSTEFHVLRPNQEFLLNRFLYHLMSDKNFRNIGAKFMTGSAGQQRVSAQYLKNFKIPVPPLKTQKQIVTKLSAAQKYKKQLLVQKSKLKELFDSVLNKSMKGEIDN